MNHENPLHLWATVVDGVCVGITETTGEVAGGVPCDGWHRLGSLWDGTNWHDSASSATPLQVPQ